MSYPRLRASILSISVLMALTATAACSSDSDGSASSSSRGSGAQAEGGSLKYGTPAYISARVQLYNNSDLLKGFKITDAELPWDPNGPTILASQFTTKLLAVDGHTPDQEDSFSGEYQAVQGQLEEACKNQANYDQYKVEISELVDASVIGAFRRLPSPVDVSGGVDCGNGRVIGGTGYPILSADRDNERTWTVNDVVAPLLPK